MSPVQTRAGRDLYFYNDLMSGRLAILNLQHADCATLSLPSVRQVPDAGMDKAYLYSLSLQPAIRSPVDLRRYMEAFGTGAVWPIVSGAPHEIELVRLRLGMYSGA